MLTPDVANAPYPHAVFAVAHRTPDPLALGLAHEGLVQHLSKVTTAAITAAVRAHPYVRRRFGGGRGGGGWGGRRWRERGELGLEGGESREGEAIEPGEFGVDVGGV